MPRYLLTLSVVFLSFGCVDSFDPAGPDETALPDESAASVTAKRQTRYEAEAFADQRGCRVRTNYPDFTGNGFVDYGGTDTWVKWTDVRADAAGEHELRFRYANGSGAPRRMALIVNGTRVATFEFAATPNWRSWRSMALAVPLRKGNNVVRLRTMTASGGPNLDHFVVVGPASAPDPDPTPDPDPPPRGELKIVVFAVNSADSALVVFPTGKTMLIDSATSARFADRVLPFLRRHGIRHLDYYVESHPHQDHIGGRARLLAEGYIDGDTEQWDWETFDYEDSFGLEGARFFIYNARDRAFHGTDANFNSLAFRIEYNGFVYTTGGDEGLRSMNRFRADHPQLVRAHVRNTAHHLWGPVSRPFLVASDPYLIIISSIRAVREERHFTRDFLGAVNQLLDRGRLREYALTAEVGHIIIRAANGNDWSYDFCSDVRSCVTPAIP